MSCLSRDARHRTSRAMPDLFDMRLRAMRRDRAARIGTELFLYERVFEDLVERIDTAGRKFATCLLVGSPDASWKARLGAVTTNVVVVDPGPLFAASSGGSTIEEDRLDTHGEQFDLIMAIGTLDTVNDLPVALMLLAHALRDGGLLIGALSGGDTLPRLRSAMRSADAVSGIAAPHVHPRIAPAALAPLIEQAGLVRPVVDVDRVEVAYPSFARLVRDLRAMGVTNILADRPRRYIGRAELASATETFAVDQDQGRTIETFEILHFTAVKPGRPEAESRPATR